jgi:hypothetical protein
LAHRPETADVVRHQARLDDAVGVGPSLAAEAPAALAVAFVKARRIGAQMRDVAFHQIEAAVAARPDIALVREAEPGADGGTQNGIAILAWPGDVGAGKFDQRHQRTV